MEFSWFSVLMYGLLAFLLYRFIGPIKGMKNLSAADFSEQIKQGERMIIDVREPHEFRRGHLPGAVNIPLSQLPSRMKEVPSDRRLFLYCQSGMRSKQAARLLSKQGFTGLSNLRGGIASWKGKIVS